jgi:YD repeat-containing protein
LTGRGITAGPTVAAAYQEAFDYDAGGRMWHSNSGDGVDRFYLYDKAGNQTLALASAGADLSSYASASLDYKALISSTGSIVTTGAIDTNSATTTITVYDKRGQATATRAPDRLLGAGGTATTLATAKSYNAFGEVASETDARNYTTSYGYNTMGRMVSKVSPQVSVTDVHGATSTVNPTETYGYDLSGRLVAVTDANGNVTARLLLAGSGHNGSDALVTKEFHPDSGTVVTKYDVFGDARSVTNEVGSTTLSDYDKLGRLITVTHPQRAAATAGNESGAAQQLVDHYGYDGLGQRITHWNSQFGSGVVETTSYDAKGQVMATVGFAGDTTTYAYSAFQASDVTTGLGTFGGWTRTTTNVTAGVSEWSVTDYFGRTVDSQDFGGSSHNYDYGFDKGGRLTSRSNAAGESIGWTYLNSGLVAGQTGTQGTATYGYDADGNRTSETLTIAGSGYRNATATYDALGRMTHWADTGITATIPASTDWEYDAVGNVRYVSSSHYTVAANGSTSPGGGETYWYLYDSMNRVTISQGMLDGARGSGTIERGTAGTQLTYYADGNRKSALYTATVYGQQWVMDYTTGYYAWNVQSFTYDGDRREDYIYTADGYLAETDRADSWAEAGAQPTHVDDDPNTIYHEPPATGTLETLSARDALGRITHYKEIGITTGTFERSSIVYDNAGRELSETELTYRYDTGTSSFSYLTTLLTSTYAGGLLTQQVQDTYKGTTAALNSTTDAAIDDSRQTYSYVWWDGALQNVIGNDKDNSGGTPEWSTTYHYDASGHVTSAGIVDGRSRTVTFVTDQNGMVVDRREADGNYAAGDPHEVHYEFAGLQLGEIGNNGTDNLEYSQSIRDRLTVQPNTSGAFRGGVTTPTPFADFEQSYDAINGSSNADTGSGYTARGGETLMAVAQSLWGDASLWYLIADANGMSGSETLAAGQTLTIPNKVVNRHNSADTFRPYDPNEALGDNSPTSAAQPPKVKKGACGAFGQILQSIVTMAVTIALSFTPLAPVAPIIGDAYGQLFGMATGIQQGGFNWSELGHVALMTLLTPGSSGDPFIDGLNTALADAKAQGIEIAIGLKHKFDFTEVAVAGVTAGVTTAATNAAGSALHLQSGGQWNSATARAVGAGIGGVAGAVAGAATRSVITGTDFGDNLIAALPSALVATAANIVAGQIVDGANDRARVRALEQQAKDANQPAVGSGAAGAPVAGLSGGGGSSYTLSGPKGMTVKRSLSPLEQMLGFDLSDPTIEYDANRKITPVGPARSLSEAEGRLGIYQADMARTGRMDNDAANLASLYADIDRQKANIQDDTIATATANKKILADQISKQSNSSVAVSGGAAADAAGDGGGDIVITANRAKSVKENIKPGGNVDLTAPERALLSVLGDKRVAKLARTSNPEVARFGNSLAGIGGTVARAGPGAEGASVVGGTLTADVLAPALVIGGLLVAGEVWLQTNGAENEFGNPWSSFRGGSGTEMGPYGPTIVNSDPMDSTGRNSSAAAPLGASGASSAAAPLPPDPDFDPDHDPFETDAERFRRLNKPDAGQGKLRPNEAETAAEIEKQKGWTLERNPVKGADFIRPSTGETIDTMFDRPVKIDKFNDNFANNFNNGAKITEHLNKYDYVGVNTRYLSSANNELLNSWLESQPKVILKRIIVVK